MVAISSPVVNLSLLMGLKFSLYMLKEKRDPFENFKGDSWNRDDGPVGPWGGYCEEACFIDDWPRQPTLSEGSPWRPGGMWAKCF